MYNLTTYSKNRAKDLGVTIKPSTRKGKKIDVFKAGKKIASIGAVGYMDYPNYKKKYGKKIADERKKAYYSRHKKDIIKGTPGYYAAKILW